VSAPWWPPKVGDKLRTMHHVERGKIERLCHVVSVFEHAGQTRAAVAYFGSHKRWWHYEIVSALDAEFGAYWPDGAPDPRSNARE
jgi:hypothetical protein